MIKRSERMLKLQELLTLGLELLLIASLLLLSACSAKQSPKITESSPQFTQAELSVGSDLTELGQWVELRLCFDKPLEAKGQLADSFDVRLNDEALDEKTMSCEYSLDGSKVLIRIVPSAAADGLNSSLYFALYAGKLSVQARDDSGGLANVCALDDGASAVLAKGVSCIVPSGLAFSTDSVVRGDEASGTCAQTTISITQFAQIRAVTWISLGQGEPVVLKHNHQFLRDTQRTCAENLAAAINAELAGQFVANSSGASVTITALLPQTDQLIEPSIIEGVMDDPDAALAHAAVSPQEVSGDGSYA